jgi:putative Mg2+ transporter-C (MgtC) family protein
MNELAEMMLRLVLAGVLGGLIGAEREYRGKVAGTRTHLLVALGSALMLLVSQHGFGGQGDPGRVAAQIVSGIGFIGAGAIMVDRQSIHGLTTAAGIWVSAGIGMAAAAGLYALAVATTVLALIGLEVFGIILFSDRRRKQGKGEDGKNICPLDAAT